MCENAFSVQQIEGFIDRLLSQTRNPSLHGRNLSFYSGHDPDKFFNEMVSVEAILMVESLFGLMKDPLFSARRTPERTASPDK